LAAELAEALLHATDRRERLNAGSKDREMFRIDMRPS